MVKIRMRFYLPHDMDLISLMITHEMDIVRATYCAVTAFTNHDSFAIRIPPLRDIPMQKKHVYHGNLSLDEEKDKNVLELLECIEPGYRNNFLKNILRLYLFCPATEAFLKNSSNMGKFEERFKVFTDGKRFADAAKVKQKRQRKSIPVQAEKEVFVPKETSVKTPEMPFKTEPVKTNEDVKKPENLQDSDDLTELFANLIN